MNTVGSEERREMREMREQGSVGSVGSVGGKIFSPSSHTSHTSVSSHTSHTSCLPHAPCPIPNAPYPNPMSQKILIVDDEPNILTLMEQALEDLEDEGVELLTAKNGEEALEMIKTEKPNLVFLDVMMPKMNGLKVCQIVKHELQMTDIHIIILTAKGQEFDKQKGIEVGADLYLTKPFRPKEVLEKSMEVLGIH